MREIAVGTPGNTMRSTVAAHPTPTGRPPISIAGPPEVIPWPIAKQMRGSATNAALATGEETVGGEEVIGGEVERIVAAQASVEELEIIVAVQAIGEG